MNDSISFPCRIVANYIAYWIVNTFASYTLEDLWTLTYSSHRNWTSEKVCTSITKTFMSEAISRLFIDKYFPPLTRYHVSHMIPTTKFINLIT